MESVPVPDVMGIGGEFVVAGKTIMSIISFRHGDMSAFVPHQRVHPQDSVSAASKVALEAVVPSVCLLVPFEAM